MVNTVSNNVAPRSVSTIELSVARDKETLDKTPRGGLYRLAAISSLCGLCAPSDLFDDAGQLELVCGAIGGSGPSPTVTDSKIAECEAVVRHEANAVSARMGFDICRYEEFRRSIQAQHE